jgi:hypothetical protein
VLSGVLVRRPPAIREEGECSEKFGDYKLLRPVDFGAGGLGLPATGKSYFQQTDVRVHGMRQDADGAAEVEQAPAPAEAGSGPSSRRESR